MQDVKSFNIKKIKSVEPTPEEMEEKKLNKRKNLKLLK
jgi:hypothetical protein